MMTFAPRKPHTPYPAQLPKMPFGIPAGAVMAFAGKVAEKQDGPSGDFETMVETYGWMLCDGRTLLKNDYPVLYYVLGTEYNTGTEKANEFSIPDYRGLSDFPGSYIIKFL